MVSLRKVARFQLGYNTLLERDLDYNHSVEIQGFHADCYNLILNRILVFRLIGQIFPNLSHLFQNKFVTLCLAKALFPRDLDDCSTISMSSTLPLKRSVDLFEISWFPLSLCD